MISECRSKPEKPSSEDLWRAYERVQAHYECDLQLFSVRMNMFLLIQSALVGAVGALFGSVANGTKVQPEQKELLVAVASFGLAMAVGWLFVAVSSYMWLKTWRAQMIDLGDKLRQDVYLDVFSRLFHSGLRRRLHEQIYGTSDCSADSDGTRTKADSEPVGTSHHVADCEGTRTKSGSEPSGASTNPKRWLAGHPQLFWKQSERFSWFVRPTFVTCCLPSIFIAAWIYLLIYVIGLPVRH